MAQETQDTKYYTPEEVAEILSVKSYTVRSWINNNQIAGIKLPNGRWRISREALMEFVNETRG